MSAIRRGVLASIADKYVCQVIAVVTLAIMSRILTPGETGLYLLANTVIVLSDNLRSLGVGVFIVQEQNLKRETVRSTFTIALLMSLGIALAVNLVAGQISSYFHEPELAHLLLVATLAFVVLPFGSPIIALLQRDLSFAVLAVLNVVGAVTNAVVTISLGASGFGPVSYIWGYVASSTVLVVCAILYKPNFWIFRPGLSEARRIVSFGAISTCVTVLNMAYDMLPRLVLARILGVDAMGVYARAVTVCQLPERSVVSALQPVVLPAMAAHSRIGGDIKIGYLRGHMLLSGIQWPTLIMLALLADPVVRILLGPQWLEATPLVRVIALATMASAPAFMTFPVLVSVGLIRYTLYLTLISLPPSALMVIGAATISLNAVAGSLFIIAPMQMLLALLFIRRAIGLTGKELAAASRKSALVAVGTALLPALVILLSPNGFTLSVGEAVIAAIGGAIGWLAAVIATDHPIKGETFGVLRMLAAAFRQVGGYARAPAK